MSNLTNTLWGGTCRQCRDWTMHRREGDAKIVTCTECGADQHIDNIRAEWMERFGYMTKITPSA